MYKYLLKFYIPAWMSLNSREDRSFVWKYQYCEHFFYYSTAGYYSSIFYLAFVFNFRTSRFLRQDCDWIRPKSFLLRRIKFIIEIHTVWEKSFKFFNDVVNAYYILFYVTVAFVLFFSSDINMIIRPLDLWWSYECRFSPVTYFCK